MNLPADILLHLDALSSAIKHNQNELYTNAATELIQLVVQYASEIIFSSDLTEALCSLISWLDNEIIEQCKLVERPTPSTEIGLDLLENLKGLLETSVSKETDEHEPPNKNFDVPANDDPVPADNRDLSQPGSIDELLKQLSLRKTETFDPKFPKVVLTDSEDDSEDVKVDEQCEHRIMRHGAQTTQQEVEKRQNGQEIRTKKISTTNSFKSSKTITIKITGGKGTEDLLKKFRDQKTNFNTSDDFEQEVNFPCKPSEALDDKPNDGDNSPNDLVIKTKNVQHNSATLQTVSRQAKRNGQVKLNQSSQRLDFTDLSASQVNTYDNNQLIDLKGEGVLVESSVIQNRNGNQSEWSILLPPRKHVEHYIKTIESKDGEESGNFFRATALESYIALNHNFIMFEEQQHRQINYSFGLTGLKAEAADFSLNLNSLTSVADDDKFVLPKMIDTKEEVPQAGQFLSITNKTGILESFDASDYLVFQDESNKEIRGGPCDALIVHASSSRSSLLFQEAFITTFPSFIAAEQLIKKLIHRYLYFSNVQSQEATKTVHQSFSLLVRIIDSLCYVELNSNLLKNLATFTGKLLRSQCYSLVKVFRQRLSERLNDYRRGQLFRLYQPATTNSSTKTIFDVSSSLIAKQLTHLDSKLFKKIEIAEMIWWAADQSEKKCPNIQAMTRHFNNVSYWMRSKILEPEERKERERRFNKFLKVAKHLKKLGNFNAYLATLSALDSSPVRRLNWPQSLREQIKSQVSIMDTRQSFKNYRTTLAQTKPPCLPYFGLILQDLTFIHLGNCDYLMHESANNLLNFGKRWQQYVVLDSVRCFSRWSYDIEQNDKIISLFDDFAAMSEEDGWARSYQLEPRT